MNHSLCRWILCSPLLERSRRLAAYLPHGGEPDLQVVLDAAVKQGCETFLPVVQSKPEPHLIFRHWQPGEPLESNQYGIPEPPKGKREVSPETLCAVLVPLVAFDPRGNRLGMGAGYYDRSFAFLREHPTVSRPALIGTAWEFQQVAELQAHKWDVPLDATVTEKGWHGPWHPRAHALMPAKH